MSATDAQGFDYEAGLFDVDPGQYTVPPKDKPTRTQMAHRKVSRRIGAGVHPLGPPIRLHADAPRDLDYQEAQRSSAGGPRCGSCQFRVLDSHHDKHYPKCYLPTRVGDREIFPRVTHCDSSDIAAWWPACTSWQPKGQS